jgi:3-deoxy-7-phosphoheptulonate synthase
MIIRMKTQASAKSIEKVLERIRSYNCTPEIIHGKEGIDVIGIVGDTSGIDPNVFDEIEEVLEVIRISRPYKRVSREFNPNRRVITVGGHAIGGSELTFMAGPCSVESKEQIERIAKEVKEAGAQFLRGGAYKPRTSPYAYQGLGVEGLKHMLAAKKQTGLSIVTEATGTHRHILRNNEFENADVLENVLNYADIIQVGARNMKAYGFLQELAFESGKRKIPVMLKRGEAATITEFLLAAEYIVANGNPDVILCPRGIRTFEEAKFQRYTPDLAAIPILKKESNLPVIFDPSHAIGYRDMVMDISLAAIAAGADGLVVEVHYDPENAASDGQQTVTPEVLRSIIKRSNAIGKVIAQS